MQGYEVRAQSYVGGMSSGVFTSRVLPIFSLGLFMTAVSAVIGWNLPSFILILAVIAELVMVITARAWAYNERSNANIGMFLLLTALTGLTTVPILKWGLHVGGISLLAQALGSTAITFGALAAYGATTKKDFSGIGGFLLASLLGVIIASIINMFIGAKLTSLVISSISVAIFSGFVLYDMSMIRRYYSDNDYIMASLALYLDFINLFQNILNILGIVKSDD